MIKERKIANVNNTDKFKINDIYKFQLSFNIPYFFKVDFEDWKKSFTEGARR